MTTRRKPVLRTVALAAGLMLAPRALAVDYTIPVKITVIKPGKLFEFVAKGTFILPDPNGDNPAMEGASLCFQGTTGGRTYALDASIWKGLGPGGDGSKGFKAKDAICKSVIVKAGVIKGVCKPDTGDVGPLPEPGPVAIVLSIGDGPTRYCGKCGGTPTGNTEKVFKAKSCDAPAACAVCGGGTSTTSSSTTSTSIPGTTLFCCDFPLSQGCGVGPQANCAQVSGTLHPGDVCDSTGQCATPPGSTGSAGCCDVAEGCVVDTFCNTASACSGTCGGTFTPGGICGLDGACH